MNNILDKQCPTCSKRKPRSKNDCQIRKNVFMDKSRESEMMSVSFIENGMCKGYDAL